MTSDWIAIGVTQALNAATTISTFALIALGLAIIYGMMGIINLAHGEFFMLGAYALWLTMEAGGSFWLGLLMAAASLALIGGILERAILRLLRDRFLDTILATWGISMFLREGVRGVFGNDTKTMVSPLPASIHAGSVVYPVYYFFVIAVSLALVGGTLLFFRYTVTGIKARAVLQSHDAAAVLGINTRRMNTMSFALGAALAGVAGAVMSPLIGIYPSMGLGFVVQSFMAVILGGLGGLGGVLAGSTVIGGLQSMLTFFIEPVAGITLTLALVIVILCFRPKGLFQW
ncbi:MAG: branched-chain amino acid ABC transporter permease [Candidatus Rokuibacteriota bacterium]